MPVGYDATPGGPGNHYHRLGWIASHAGVFQVPTPRAADAHGAGLSVEASQRLKDKGQNFPLGAAVKLLPTPRVSASTTASFGCPTLEGIARQWPTPRSMDGEMGGRPQWKDQDSMEDSDYGPMLASAVVLGEREGAQARGFGLDPADSSGGALTPPTAPSGAGPAAPGGAGQKQPRVLNPDWVEWLMAWPIGWTDLRPLGTDRYRSWLLSLSAVLLRLLG